MDFRLGNKICLVTGASSGIGYACSLALAAEGAHLIVAGRTLERLQTLQAEVERLSGKKPVLIAADLATVDEPRRLAEDALAHAGRVDILINAAGGSRPIDANATEEAWSEAFQLNFIAARQLAELVVPAMLNRRWGRIINLSGAVVSKAPNAATPAKAALESWSKAIAAAYAADGITVNCVAPGRIKSEQILDRLHPTEASRQSFIERNIPAGRFGEPHEAAALIAFLASEPASYITGTTIPVDGGALRYAF